ncbi:trypsin-like peptidase domain-containing protein [Candidatus Sumerlaeota bacterium]|nr:trypsin-like peptidase domain-containing protein [Candidatus Sumerlaeota bacterium]
MDARYGMVKNGLFLACFSLFLSCCCLFQGHDSGSSPGDISNKRNLDFEGIIQNAKSKVFPALVFIKPICEEFSTGEKRQQEVFGSGVIISEDGYVVTNNHVVEKAIQINCVLFDKDQYAAKIVGLDPETDLALLKIESKSDGASPSNAMLFPVAPLGDSDTIQEGQFVMALGSPFGFTRSISLGIISNVHRYIGFQTQYKYNTWIQTDAAINPGNSGGPLVNTDGMIIGVNTLGLVGLAEGMAFSIPVNVVKDVVERLKKDGRVLRAWTGLHLQALKDFQTNTFTPGEKGVLIQNVDSDSPAQKVGIKSGDILISINGEDVQGGMYVEELPEIRSNLADLVIGNPARVRVLRNGETLEFELVPLLKDKFEGADFDCRRWSFTVKEISKFSTPDLYFLRNEGIYIQGVRYPGNANNAGLQKNDIILSIDEIPINSLADIERIYEEITSDEDREKKVVIKVLRKNYPRLFVLDYRHDYSEED